MRNRLRLSLAALAGAALLVSSPAPAQRTLKVAPSATGEQRLALVIGNDSYLKVNKLQNARADARAIARALEAAGFKVTLRIDANEKTMKEAVRAFKSQLGGGDVAVFYFSGHGVQLANTNYLLPVDINAETEDQVKDDSLPLQRVLDDLQEQKAKFSLAIIDACRDNPFRGVGRAIGGRGLAPTTAATGQMIIFSAGAGQQALDRLNERDRDPNGLFTRIFIREMERPGVPVDRVLRNVRDEVVRLAKNVGREQVPALYDQVVGDFYFRPGSQLGSAAPAAPAADTVPAPAATIDPLTVELSFWDSVKDSRSTDELRAYLSSYPSGRFAELARARMRSLEAATPGAAPPQLAVAPPSISGTRPPAAAGSIAAMSPGTSFRDCDVCPEMVVIPPGTFMMGSPTSEQGRFPWEGPQHSVTIARAFAAGKYEVTFDEWDACVRESGCSWRPGNEGWSRGRRPVIYVSWNDAKQYAQWLSRKAGHNYRLLTEAEWEYVARAGTTTPFNTGASINSTQANYDATVTYAGSVTGPYRRQTVPVGSFQPNAFGLFDMHGNVWEWTEDCWNASYNGAPADGSAWTSGVCGQRMLRGGSWIHDPHLARSAYRNRGSTSDRFSYFGFRLARTD